MPRILVVGATPLVADGLLAALGASSGADGDARGHPSSSPWAVRSGRADEAADAWVLPAREITVRGASGAMAQLSAGTSAGRLRAAVAAVLQGLSVRETPWPQAASGHEALTLRELEVFELLGKGLSNRDIGRVLAISVHTAKYHVGQILAKLGATTRAEAVGEGLRHGLIGL